VDTASIAQSAVALQQSETRQTIELAVIKQKAEAEQAIVRMIADAVSALLPAGVGGALDVRA
jgi:hypothetical protein